MSTNNPMSNIPPLGPPTGMMPGGGSGKFKPIDPMRVIRANWLWIAFAVVMGGGLGTGVWFGLNALLPQYTSDSQFEVQATSLDSTGRRNPVRMIELEPLILGEVQKIMSEPILRTILDEPSVQQTKWFKSFKDNLDLAYEDLSEEVLVANHVRDTPLFFARARTPEKQDAQIILTALHNEYMRLNRGDVQRVQDRELNARQDRLNAVESKITGIRAAIQRFLANNKLETIDERSSEAALQVGRLVFEKNELVKSYNSLKATHDQLQLRLDAGDFDPSDEERQFLENSREIIEIDSQLRQLRVARESQMVKFGPGHDVIKALDEQIRVMENERKLEFDQQARNLFNAKLEQAALGLQILNEQVQKATDELAEWTAIRQDNFRKLDEYNTLNREVEAAEEERAIAQQAIADLLEEIKNEARVEVEVSVPPQQAKQSFPPEPYITIPGVAAFFTALVTGLIFLRELMDQRVRSAADVKMIPDAALLGLIPDANQDRGSGSVQRVVEEHPAGLLAESFRQVRTAVLSKMDRRGYKTLMVVSAKPGAGVTAVAQNLGASCALSGRRVLLIDANFRRPGMAGLMKLQAGTGLADLLNGEKPIDSALSHIIRTDTNGLSLLSSGNTHGAAVELFESPRFRELMARLESEFDLLIIDAPPALLTSDAQLLSRHIDAMLLVSRARTDTRGMLQRVYRELDGQRADILGVVLNGVQASAGGYLKQNFQEFRDYASNDPGKPDRPRGRTAAKAATAAVATTATGAAAARSNGSAASANGDTVRIDPPIQDSPISNLADDEDLLGGFDLTDDEEQDK